MKYLLLGGAGFIGTHLAKRLIKEGHEVTIVDSLVTGRKPNFPVKFIQCDIRNAVLDELLIETDVVYFLAGSVGVAYIDRHPKETLDNNIGLMTKLIPLFERYQKPVIFSSTSEVYGDGPFDESNSLNIGAPTKLRWGYAAAKLMTEFSIVSCTFPYVIFRFFNVTGPGQLPDYGMVLPRFIKAAKDNEDLEVYGNGTQVRSFCHVDDAIEYMRRLENSYGEIFNLGAGEPISVLELAQLVIKLSNSQSKIRMVTYSEAFSKHHGDISKRLPILTKLKYFSGYLPVHDTESIIKDML